MNMSNEILTEDIEDIHARHYAVDGPYKRIIDGHFGHKSTLKPKECCHIYMLGFSRP